MLTASLLQAFFVASAGRAPRLIARFLARLLLDCGSGTVVGHGDPLAAELWGLSKQELEET